MSEYQIIKNKSGVVIAYGANDGNFEVTLQPGETMEIVTDDIAKGFIAELHQRLETEALAATQAVETQKAAILTKLGITADELRIALS